MRKSLIVLILLLFVMTTGTALASWTWCSTDPEIVLPGGQGSLFVWVDVPTDYAGETIELYLAVPAGSEILPHTGEVDVQTVIVREAPAQAGVVIATVNENFPVQLRAQLGDNWLRTVEFASGMGVAAWPIR